MSAFGLRPGATNYSGRVSKGELRGAEANLPQDEAIRQEDDDAPEVTDVDSGHVERRTIVLLGRRILYVPNLKAGCTSLLWMLAHLAEAQGSPV